MERQVKTLAAYLVVLVCVFLTTTAPGVAQPLSDSPQVVPTSNQEKSWKEEFDRICAQTEIATSLTKEQILKLISDTDKLIGQLGKLDDPWTKVYIFRLEKCQDFFRFALEWQEMEQQGETS